MEGRRLKVEGDVMKYTEMVMAVAVMVTAWAVAEKGVDAAWAGVEKTVETPEHQQLTLTNKEIKS